jgi:hypothetical protein
MNNEHSNAPTLAPSTVLSGAIAPVLSPSAVMWWDGGERAITAREKSLIEEHGPSSFSIALAPAGSSDAWTNDARTYGNALNEAAWLFVDQCPEKSALLFNSAKVVLRSAILRYAELVGVVPPAKGIDLWRPINTAPQDGRSMLLGHLNPAGNWRTLRGRWFSKEQIEQEWEDADDFEAGWFEESVEADDVPNVWPTQPTHWQPLPSAPVIEGQRGAAPGVSQ